MKRSRSEQLSPAACSAKTTELVRYASAAVDAGSRLEYRFWEKQLYRLIYELIRRDNEDALTHALDLLFDTNATAHNELVDTIEACVETLTIRQSNNNENFKALLVAVPILAWSRFSIPSGKIDQDTLNTLSVQLRAHTLAEHTQLMLTDFLFSPDHLPRTYAETLRLTETLTQAALTGTNPAINLDDIPQIHHFLSDIRYLVGVVITPTNQPCFRWQEKDGNRETALRAWNKQGSPSLEPLLVGCSFQPLLINSYHSACHLAELQSRAYSLQASVLFLQAVLDVKPEALQCVVAAFHDKDPEEYRIAFLAEGSTRVVHGVVWPLSGDETDNEPLNEIGRVLNECGIHNITVLPQTFPFEFCDDCGAPLFPNLEGETVHAELPSDQEDVSPTLH